MTKARVVILVLAVLMLIPAAMAQTVTGTMKGTVTDNTGAALPGVTVTIRSLETGLERIVVTNTNGAFNAPFLPIGKYRVTAELSGFGGMRHENVRLELNQTIIQDFILKPAAVSETITVSADAPRIDVTDGEVKQTLRSEEIMAMPNPVQDGPGGAAFLRLATVFSGYQENPTSGQDNPTASSGSSVNFNGTGTRGTTFQINGVNNDDSSENQHRQGVALATIKNFQVLTNNFSSEFGRGYGAVVLVQTKSGTNTIDGEVYGGGTDAKWNSLDYFSKLAHAKKPNNFRRNYGATGGFPIIRDTLFGYASYEYVQNLGRNLTTKGLFLPSDFTGPRLTLGNDTPANRAWQDMIVNRWPKNATPNRPLINSRAYETPYFRTWPNRDASGRLDWNLSVNNTLTARYQKSHQIAHNEDVIVGEQTEQNNRQSNVGLEWVNVISSNTVQEARYGLGLRRTAVNILDGNDTPIVRFTNMMPGSYSMTILGNAGNFPINRNQRDQQFVYNLSTTHFNTHTLKVGTDIRRGTLNDKADNYSRGYWTFNLGTRCGQTFTSAVEMFWAGCVYSYWKAYGPFALYNDINEENAYAQDDWRPLDNLTLNLGVRYERTGAPKEQHHLLDYMYKTTDYVDPRLGFAYTPNWEGNRILRAMTGGNGKFSIRGGFGTFHGRIFQSIFSQGGANVRFNPPNAALFMLSGNNFADIMPGADSRNLADPTNGYKFVPGQVAKGASVMIIDKNLQMPETRQWNLTFERQIFRQQRLRLSYIGNIGRNLIQYQPDNTPIPPTDPRSKYKIAADWLCAGTGFTVDGTKYNPTTQCPNSVPLADNEISIRVPRTALRRPDPNYSGNTKITNAAKSWYNAGQVEWESGIIHGFNGRLTYTYAKAFDTGSEATYVGAGDTNALGWDDKFKRGASRFDTRHRVTALGSYELPWFKDTANPFTKLAFGGWQVSTVVRYSTGTPFTITDSRTLDYDFDGFTMNRPVALDPKWRGGWVIGSPSNSQEVLNSSHYRTAQPGDKPGDLIPRNSFYSGPKSSIDLGIYKSFSMPFGNVLMVRVDAFNVTDHVNWGFPTTDVASSSFGRLATTNYSPRIVQVGFRYLY